MRICHEVCYDILMLKTKKLFANLTIINWLRYPYTAILTQNNVKLEVDKGKESCKAAKKGREQRKRTKEENEGKH